MCHWLLPLTWRHTSRSPPATAIIPLLNLSSRFGAVKASSQVPADVLSRVRVELYLLTSLALCRARRFVQAAEMFGRAEASLFEREGVGGSSMPPWLPATLYKAASMCLLAADGLSHVNQLADRLVSQQCAVGGGGEVCTAASFSLLVGTLIMTEGLPPRDAVL